MAEKLVPFTEAQLLARMLIQTFNQQFRKTIDFNDTTFDFIPPRETSRFGFQVQSTDTQKTLKLRLYNTGFSASPGINPFLQEETSVVSTGPGDEVYVTISDLSVRLFPVLSTLTNPVLEDERVEYGFLLEDRFTYLALEGEPTTLLSLEKL